MLLYVNAISETQSEQNFEIMFLSWAWVYVFIFFIYLLLITYVGFFVYVYATFFSILNNLSDPARLLHFWIWSFSNGIIQHLLLFSEKRGETEQGYDKVITSVNLTEPHEILLHKQSLTDDGGGCLAFLLDILKLNTTPYLNLVADQEHLPLDTVYHFSKWILFWWKCNMTLTHVYSSGLCSC